MLYSGASARSGTFTNALALAGLFALALVRTMIVSPARSERDMSGMQGFQEAPPSSEYSMLEVVFSRSVFRLTDRAGALGRAGINTFFASLRKEPSVAAYRTRSTEPPRKEASMLSPQADQVAPLSAEYSIADVVFSSYVVVLNFTSGVAGRSGI